MLQSAYKKLCQQQNLTSDSNQLAAVEALDAVSQALSNNQSVNSLYIFGPVGRGKSMLMDLFFQQLPITAKVRMHYHHFMREVHAQLNLYEGEENPLIQVAEQWSQRYRVICLDEFIVEDIGDAMLLATLWTALFNNNTVLVTTSNTPPKELYRGGLARHRFEPFIELLEQQCDVLNLDSGIDYRRIKSQHCPYFFVNADQNALAKLIQQTGTITTDSPITIMNRPLRCLWHNDTVIGFDFWQLCSGPRSQRDYMELADQFKVIVVDAVPQFSASTEHAAAQGIEDSYQRQQSLHLSRLDNEARRFIALVDECYDRGCLLLINAAVAIDELYQAEHLKFPFQRCASRLIEMQSWNFPDSV
jgi:cell division protein ZapE